MNDQELDAKIDELLKETIDLIPELFPDDAEMRMRLVSRVPAIKSVTRKLWRAFGARSVIEFCVLNGGVGNAFVSSNPKTLLECQSTAQFSEKMLGWTERTLGIHYSEEELQGREALDVITQKIAAQANAKLSKLRHGL
jgi:hypothetical protein